MAGVDAVRNKVQRILANEFGSVEIDNKGRFVIKHESSVTFIDVEEWSDNTIVSLTCPMLTEVEITPELTRWIAVDGQNFIFGNTSLSPDENGTTGWVFFEHNLLGDDLDEPELIRAVVGVVVSANNLDNELRDKFGGRLFGPDV